MNGPHPINNIEHEIYLLVISSKAREGETFPSKYIYLNMMNAGYTLDDFKRGVESLQEKGLVTVEEKISNDFFNVLGSI